MRPSERRSHGQGGLKRGHVEPRSERTHRLFAAHLPLGIEDTRHGGGGGGGGGGGSLFSLCF